MSRNGGRLALCQLGMDARAPSRARRFAAAFCGHLPPDTVVVVRLLTTELAANALWHGAGDPLMDIDVTDGIVMVGVTDHGRPSVQIATNRWPKTGHGLRLVDALSDQWGVDDATDGPGKRVWFKLCP